jgi:hypothetical protein
MKMGDENTFTCDGCKGTFIKGWTDADAAREYEDTWKDDPEYGEETGVLCDDCHAEFMAWFKEMGIDEK